MAETVEITTGWGGALNIGNRMGSHYGLAYDEARKLQGL